MNPECEFLAFVRHESRVANYMTLGQTEKKRMKHTNIDCQVSDGWQEDFDIGTCNEFGVHPSCILKQSAPKQTLRAVIYHLSGRVDDEGESTYIPNLATLG